MHSCVALIPTMCLPMLLVAMSMCGGSEMQSMFIDSSAVPQYMVMSVDKYAHVSICCSRASCDAIFAV